MPNPSVTPLPNPRSAKGTYCLRTFPGETESNEPIPGQLGHAATREGSMMARVLDVLFGCRHSHYSFPITVRSRSRRTAAASLTGTYVACLDCGKEFPYDWQDMKVITSVAATPHHLPALAPKQAV